MENTKDKKVYWVEPLKMFGRLSAWIAFPVLIGALIGNWLDNKYQSGQKWFLIVVGISFVVSMFGLVKNTLEEYKKIEKK